jgi:class 3 adenylate cyclase
MADSDFEQGRRARETANEARINRILGGGMLVALAVQTLVRQIPGMPVRPTLPVMGVVGTLALICGAVMLYLRRRPAYRPGRKHLIGGVHLVGAVALVLTARSLGQPALVLLLPVPLFSLLIALAGLRFSVAHVHATGAAALAAHLGLAATDAPLPITFVAASSGSMLLVATTLAVSRAVQGLLELHGEAVAKERLRRFFAPEVVERVIAAPELTVGAVEREVTVLFADISGFTALSSTLTPDEVVALLNDYFPSMVEVVFRHGGTLEKYIGDALLAVWGAPVPMPDHAERATRAALEMHEVLRGLNARWAAQGKRQLAIHIGLNSGRVAAGNIGTAGYIQYACIGDTTNVASRVCGVAESGEVVISQTTRAGLGERVAVAALAPVQVKGKAEALQLYRVTALGPGAEPSPSTAAVAARHGAFG